MKTFEQVSVQYEPMISALIRNLRIYRDFEAYRQAGRIALWQAWERYDHTKGDFSPFAYRSIRGALLDELKKEAAYANRITLTETEAFERITDGVTEPDRLPEWTEELNLSKEEQKLLADLYVLNRSTAELAEINGISLAGMKKRRERLLRKIRLQLRR